MANVHVEDVESESDDDEDDVDDGVGGQQPQGMRKGGTKANPKRSKLDKLASAKSKFKEFLIKYSRDEPRVGLPAGTTFDTLASKYVTADFMVKFMGFMEVSALFVI